LTSGGRFEAGKYFQEGRLAKCICPQYAYNLAHLYLSGMDIEFEVLELFGNLGVVADYCCLSLLFARRVDLESNWLIPEARVFILEISLQQFVYSCPRGLNRGHDAIDAGLSIEDVDIIAEVIKK